MMKYLFSLLVCFQVATGFALPGDTTQTPFNASFVPKEAFVFYVIGDWGRKGKGNQRPVAEAMNKCAGMVAPEFIISTGDNFYTFGVKSTKDKLWKKSYEDVYNGANISKTPWYPVLGNHDHYGNQQAEIDYSKVNSRWHMPADHYAETFNAKNGAAITFVFTNSEPLVQLSAEANQPQWTWMDSVLKQSSSTWKFVVGHHPVYSSNPMHGDSPPLQEQLKPILEKYGVQAYFCGHDHDLQHQQPKGSPVDYFVSGAGSELRPSAAYEHTLFAKSRAGFALVAITKEKMLVLFIDKDGNVIYRYERGVGL